MLRRRDISVIYQLGNLEDFDAGISEKVDDFDVQPEIVHVPVISTRTRN